MGNEFDHRDWQEDAVTIFLPFCEEQIGHHRDSIRQLKRYQLLFASLGVLLTILAFWFFRSDAKQVSENFFKLGPMLLLAPIPAVQHRMIQTSKQSLSSYLSWTKRFQSCLERNTFPPDWLTSAVTKNMEELAKPR